MKQVLIAVPIFFLLALIAIGAMLYTNTSARSGCTGADCEHLSDDAYIDAALNARAQ